MFLQNTVFIIIISNTKNKEFIMSYEKLELAPPHPNAEEEEVPRLLQPGVDVHSAVVTPPSQPCSSLTRLTLHSKHSYLSAQSSHS